MQQIYTSIITYQKNKSKLDRIRSIIKGNRELNLIIKDYILFIHDAKNILIFGPGEAKNEFLKHINKNNIAGRILEIETTDKMTDPRIIAKVKEHLFKLADK